MLRITTKAHHYTPKKSLLNHQSLRRPRFRFNSKHDFPNRFSGQPDFSNKGEQKGLLLETNFVADAVSLPLISAKERGAGGGHIRFKMAKGSCTATFAALRSGRRGHAHGPGARDHSPAAAS